MRVNKIAARQSVGLRDRKSIFQNNDIANAETIARIGAANGDSHVAGAVALLDGNAGTVLQDVADRKDPPVVELVAIDRRQGLAGRLSDATRSGGGVCSGRPARSGGPHLR